MAQRKRLRLTREQCRAVDRYAIKELRIPGIVLMENAGRNAAELILRWMRGAAGSFRAASPERSEARPAGEEPPLVSVVCGKGNNGGDGMVIARHLVRRGVKVIVDLTDDPQSLSGDAAANCKIVQRMGVPLSRLDAGSLDAAEARWRTSRVVVDALLGTGFAGAVREPLAGIIARINGLRNGDARPLIVAVDVPSGLDCDTGTAGGAAVRADRTITFLAEKTGYAARTAKPWLGRVTVADIGAPLEMILARLNIS